MSSWEVTSFSVSTSAAGEKSDLLFANGRMQVLVNVQIKASNSDSTPYTLSAYELASIRLVDYFTHDELADYGAGWVWSSQKSQFAGTLFSMGKAEFQQEPDSQLVQFWVSSTVSEKKSIAASIRQPDNTVVRTSDSSYDSSIALKAEPAITYTYPENVGLERQTAGSGTYKVHGFGKSEDCTWKNVNYYLTTKDYPLLFSETHKYGLYNRGQGQGYKTVSDEHLDNCYASQVRDDGSLSLFCLWEDPLGTTSSSPKVGMKVSSGGVIGELTADAFASITVNDKKNSVCLGRVNFGGDNVENSSPLWPMDWSYDATVSVYDIYGNCGTFIASYTDDKNSVMLRNHN